MSTYLLDFYYNIDILECAKGVIMLSEKGSLSDTPTIKLLLSVYEQKLTGILYLKKEEVLKVLYFNEGKLVWAISNSDKDKFVNILIDGGYSNEAELNPFKEDSGKDNYGKILVENGLITLEELIEVTKMQLKQIIISVLRWSDGSFQFTKDAPPQKFLSLELNIVEFISEFIFRAMDISVIWKEIGSLQIELKQNPEQLKFKMYKLSENQLGLLKLFNGKTKIENIISKYSGVQRETVLKTIYFFLISELLIKKAITFEPVKDVEEEKQNDEILSEKDYNNEVIVNINEEKDSEKYTFDKEEGSEEKEAEDLEETIIKHTTGNLSDNKDAFNGFNELNQKKNSTKMKFFLILIIIVLALSAIIFILLKDINTEIVVEKHTNVKVNEIFKNNLKPKTTIIPQNKVTNVSEEKVKTYTKNEIPVKMKNIPKKNVNVNKKTNIKTNKKNGKEALKYFKNGQYAVAMDLWKREIKSNGIKFTILLEVACEKISVNKAFNNIKTEGNFFILSRKIGKRNCYRVCWGKFISKKDAADALVVLPKYFFKQESPPEVIAIK